MRHAYTFAKLLLVMLIFSSCTPPSEQTYDDNGAAILSKGVLAQLKPEGADFPDKRTVKEEGDCVITSVNTTVTELQKYTTTFVDCASSNKLKATVQMQMGSSSEMMTVYSLTADRLSHFADTIRFADIDGDGVAELVHYSCSNNRCNRTWLSKLDQEQGQFVMFFAFEYEKLWLNEHYIVTESSFRDEVITYEVFLRKPPVKAKDKKRVIGVFHGLLYYINFNKRTHTCTAEFIHNESGEVLTAQKVPAELLRFCTTNFNPKK